MREPATNKLVIMGIQGCGKGTQAELLAAEYGLCHIPVGAVLRAHIASETYLGRAVQDYVESGHLVPDDIVGQVVRTRLTESDCNAGFILDGYPRNVSQAELLLETFNLDMVINIEVPDRIVTQRIMARRLCPICRREYNLTSTPPETEDLCDDCGEFLIVREDDDVETIAERLAEFHVQTQVVLDLFRTHCPVACVDGTRTIDEVQAEIRQKLSLAVP